jgi:indole-3-glycerol phosphate synthase
MSAAAEYRLPGNLEGTILGEIVQDKARELHMMRRKWPASSISGALESAPAIRPFKKALLGRTPAFIAEVKKASPSAGLIRADFNPQAIAREYEASGAAAISVVTEGPHFRGSLETLAQLRWTSGLPLLRKDFLFDSYQILETRHAGADALLLIAALLDGPVMKRLLSEAEALGMDALVEVHDSEELDKALEAGASLIGVNNRDLRTFKVSLDVSLNLAGRIPRGTVAVSESGISSAEDVRRLMDAGYKGLLVGERLMRAPSPGAALADLFPTPVGAKRTRS